MCTAYVCDVSAAAADAGDADDVAMATTRCDDEIDASDLPVHLQLGAQLTFSITLLQATGLPQHCTDVFAQFKSVSHIAYAQSSVVIQLNVTAADLATPEGCKAEWTWAAQ